MTLTPRFMHACMLVVLLLAICCCCWSVFNQPMSL